MTDGLQAILSYVNRQTSELQSPVSLYSRDMATLAERIRQCREALGISQGELAKRVGIKQQSIGDLESGKTRGTKHLLGIAKALGQTPEWLETGVGEQLRPAADPDMAPNVGERFPAPPISGMPLDVPEMGTAVGGANGDFSLNGQIIDYKRRPPGIANNRSVLCLRVRGDSMAPKYEEGDLVYVSPNRPTKAGDDVLVEMKPKIPGEPGNAYIKRLVSKTPTKLVLRQFNPANDRIEIQHDRVLRICYVFTMADLIGV
jgi:phage repressor protein C with HTH and peptisase S24 domain